MAVYGLPQWCCNVCLRLTEMAASGLKASALSALMQFSALDES